MQTYYPRALPLAIALVWGNAAFAENAPITTVTIYPGSATVERSVAIVAGMAQLELDGLPANFDARTIRIKTDRGIAVGQIVTRDISRTQAASAREAEIHDKIQSLQDQQAALEVETKSANLLLNYLEGMNGKAVAGEHYPYVDSKSVATIVETLRRGASDAYGRIQNAEIRKRELGKKIEVLNSELDKVRSSARDVRNITVALSARQSGTLQLSYQVDHAGWQPTYRATLDSANSTVALERLANISQKTGEDWSNVKLKLSTGQPRLSPQAPDPQPRLLSYYKPAPVKEDRRFEPVKASAPPASPAYKRTPAEEDGYVAPVIETQGAFTTEFEVPVRVTLPADGREISVALSKQPVPVRQRIRIAPQLGETAVVTAEAERPTGVWLKGNMQLFREGNYVGATTWDAQASAQVLFPFGQDDLIRVKTHPGKSETGTTGLLTQHSERRLQTSYSITSFHLAPVDLLLLESSPVSTSDEIKVTASYAPPPSATNWDQRQGVVAWEQTILPNQTLKFDVDYTVSYPKDGIVRGLP